MTKIKAKIFYEWTLWFIAFVLLVSFVVLLVYFRNTAWIAITIVAIIWFLISVITTFTIFNDNNKPNNVKLCWILVVMCIPFIGLIIFFWFGIFPFRKQKFHEYNKLQEQFAKYEDYSYTSTFYYQGEINKMKKIFRYGLNLRRPITKNNKLTPLYTPDVLFQCIMEQIKKAKYFINLQTYIVRKSEIFNMLADLLIQKRKEGVVVNFMYDWIGGLVSNPKAKIKEMKRAGINVATFNTFLYNPFTGQTNYRSHRKCLIIDNEIAIYGGSNISDDYFNLVRKNNFWKDLNWMIEGPIVNSINIVFAIDWNHFTLRSISNDVKNQFQKNSDFFFRTPSRIIQSDVICQYVESSPLLRNNVIIDNIVNALGSAIKRIWIVTPYLYPSENIVNQLVAAALAGIDVRILVPGNSDDKQYILVVNRYNYKRLLDAGVKIYEYYGFIHGKEILIDEDLMFVGTFNLDHRSLYSNFETSLIIYSKKEMQKFAQTYEEMLQTAILITKKQWERMNSWKNRERFRLLNPFHPLF